MANTTHQLKTLETRVRGAIALKDYAVSKGITIPRDVLKHVNEAEHSRGLEDAPKDKPESDIGVRIDMAISELTKLTYPTTVESVMSSDNPSRAVVIFKRALPVIAMVAIIAGIISYSWPGQNARVSYSILAMCLGLLGSLSYQMFSIIGVLQEKAFTVEDVYSNILRMILGLVMGWIFYFSFARSSFENMGSAVAGQNPSQQSNILFLLLPFLVGFSTKLVVGVMEQVIRSVLLIFGIEDKRTEILMRRRRNQETAGVTSSSKQAPE